MEDYTMLVQVCHETEQRYYVGVDFLREDILSGIHQASKVESFWANSDIIVQMLELLQKTDWV